MKVLFSDKKVVKVLLYSGGMDSYLIRELWKPDLSVYVNVSSRYATKEIENLKRLGTIPGLVKCLRGPNLGRYEREDAIIPYRNVYLVLAALNQLEKKSPLEKLDVKKQIVEICLGATIGDRVLDKSEEFTKALSYLLTYLSLPQHWTGENEREVRVVIPYKSYTKQNLLTAYLEGANEEQCMAKLSRAWKESFSCYNPDKNGKPCGMCKACFRKTVAFTLVGYKDSEYIKKARKYIEDNKILEQISKGTYGRGLQEEKDIVNFMLLTEEYR